MIDESHEYNLGVWNGHTWKFSPVIPTTQRNNPYPCGGIFGFSPTDYWLCSEDIDHWNGINYQIPQGIMGYDAEFCWGTSSNDMYFAGNAGWLTHYDGLNLTQINTGTTINIPAIWGAINPKTGQKEIICAASNEGSSPNIREIFSVNGTTITKLCDSGLAIQLSCMWFSPGNIYYMFGDGIFYKKNIYDSTAWIMLPNDKNIQHGYANGVSAQDTNDIMVACAWGDILHYSGKNWQSYYAQTNRNGRYNAISIKNNFVCAVGFNGNQPMVLFGKR